MTQKRIFALALLIVGGCSMRAGEPVGTDEGALGTSSSRGDPTCSTGIQAGKACCPASCGKCGGSGCSSRPGGAAACCTGTILAKNASCSGNKPPCVVTDGSSGEDDETGGAGGSAGSASPGDPTCSSGILNGKACCPASCGKCGGSGCSSRPGGGAACCSGSVLANNVSCSGSKPPCVVGGGSSGGGGSGGAGGSSGTGGKAGSGGSSGGSSGATACDDPNIKWQIGSHTQYTSYPAPGSEECIEYSGCEYEGQFEACNNTMSQSWVKSHNIVSIFPLGSHRLHRICLKNGSKTVMAVAVDTCADSDCSGCCTENLKSVKGATALIDVEKYTDARLGNPDDGPIQWADIGMSSESDIPGCN